MHGGRIIGDQQVEVIYNRGQFPQAGATFQIENLHPSGSQYLGHPIHLGILPISQQHCG